MSAAAPPSDRTTGSAAPQFLIVAGIEFLSRLPFLGPGYGADPDAWRVAWAARVIASTGRYEASRFPGYPLHEFLCALLSKGGPLALTGASALMAALGAGFFALTFRRLGSRDGTLAALALGSVPAFFLTSVQAMDYAWSLALALAGLTFALGGRTIVAGVLIGLAIGCRLTSALWLAPVSFAIAWARPAGTRRRGILGCAAIALAIGALAYLPVFLTYGPGFLRYYLQGRPSLLLVLRNATVELWGIPGTLGLLIAVPIGLWRARRPSSRTSIPCAGAGLLLAACVAGLALFVAAYLQLPLKAVYLVPAVPLVMLLLGLGLERRAFLAVCLALLVSPWALRVSRSGRVDSPVFATGTTTLSVAGKPLVVDWIHGPVLAARAGAKQSMAYVEKSLATARSLPTESVVVAWEWLPQIRVRLGGKVDGRVRYVEDLGAAELRDLRARGIAIYDLAGAEWHNERTRGVSLRANGSRLLDSIESP